MTDKKSDCEQTTQKCLSKKLFQLETEEYLYASVVVKVNKVGRKQERVLLVSTDYVQNLTGKNKQKINRRIRIKDIGAITCSETGAEFVIHVPEEHDQHIITENKVQFIQFISDAYKQQKNETLRIIQLKSSNLQEFVLTKYDIKAGITSKIPKQFIQQKEEYIKQREQRTKTIFSKNIGEEVSVDDFNLIKVIGRGSFGKVLLVEKKNKPGEVYAMKSLRKDAIIEKNQIEHTQTEKSILAMAHHPNLVGLQWCFQTDDKLFFVMEQMRGGELFYHLRNERRFPEKRVRFQAAQIALGMGHLHNQDIIYRDLKPENVLMDDHGNVKLTDFGMAKKLDNNLAMSFCGTPEYLAPEIIKNQKQGKPADWWSYGTLIQELIVGIPPFYSENVHEMQNRIQHAPLRFPKTERFQVSQGAQDLIAGLLNRDQKQRPDFERVKNHPWFDEIDWEKLFNGEQKPEFKPNIGNVKDTSNFDEEFTSEDVIHSMVPQHKMNMIKKFENDFKNF